MTSFPIGFSTKSTAGKVITEVSKETSTKDKTNEPFNEESTLKVKSGFAVTSDEKFDIISKTGLRGAGRRIKPSFERFAKNYTSDEPEILFIAEYIVEDEFVGALVVWENYYDSTHYEVFKRNLFDTDTSFDRILFLDKASLVEEREHFVGYIKDVLGFKDLEEGNYFVILDTIIKEDRIYEYKISASRVPKAAREVDYDFVLESKNLLNPALLSLGSENTLFDFAEGSLGARDLAWVVALANDEFDFFGRKAVESSLSSFFSNPTFDTFDVQVPKNINDILSIVDDSISLFGIKNTFLHLVDSLGGLPELFKSAFEASVDETRNVFSFDQFVSIVSPQIPILQLIFEVSESRDPRALVALSQLSVILPRETGSESLSSMTGLSRIMKFVNEFYLLVSYAQEAETFTKIQEIIDEIEARRELEGDDVASGAVGEIRNQVADQTKEQSALESSLFGVDVGKKEDAKSSTKQTPTSTTNEETTDDSVFGNTTVKGVNVL